VFLLAPTAQVASYAGELEDAKEEVRKNPDDASAHKNLGVAHTRKEDKGESTGSIWVTNQEQQYGPRTQSGAGCDGM
jgi:hypothetical protein